MRRFWKAALALGAVAMLVPALAAQRGMDPDRKIEGGGWKERDVTASFGVASLTGKMENAAALTQAADDALYASKAAGRNRTTHAKDIAK